MTKTYTIQEFMNKTHQGDSLKVEIATFMLVNLLLAGAYEALTIATKAVEAVEWF